MDVNPFLNWLHKLGATKKGETYYIPATSVLELLYDHFGIDERQLSDLKNPRLEKVKTSLISFWAKSNFKQNGIQVEGKKINKVDPIGKPVAVKGFYVQYIDGWLSTEELNASLKKALEPPKVVAKSTRGNTNNPFNEFDFPYLPDVDYLPQLYKTLGVKSFEQLNLTRVDYVQAFEGVSGSNFVHDVAVRRLGPKGEILYLKKFPSKVLDRLFRRVINLQNAQSHPTRVVKDVLRLIALGNLSGKDLLSFCISHPEVNEFCDDALFIKHLAQEFGIDWKLEKHGFPTPRELYVQMHTGRVEIVDSTKGEHQYRAIVVQGEGRFVHTIAYLVPHHDFEKVLVDVAIAFIFPRSTLFSFIYFPRTESCMDADTISEHLSLKELIKFCKLYYGYFKGNRGSWSEFHMLEFIGHFLPGKDPRLVDLEGRIRQTNGLAWYENLMGPNAPLYLRRIEVLKKK
jgi:hypothetical protein